MDQGKEVVILVRSSSDLWRLKGVLDRCVRVEIDKVSLDSVFLEHSIETVVHTACSYGRNGESLSSVINTNINFGVDILQACIKHEVKTFVNTDTLLPKEVSVYSLSKWQFRDWLKFHGANIQVINMKIEQMYGPEDDKNKFIPWVIHHLVNKQTPLELTSGVQKRSFLFIDDVVSAFNTVLLNRESLVGYREFDIASRDLVQVRKFVETIAELIERTTKNRVHHLLLFGKKKMRKNENILPEFNTEDIEALGWKAEVGYRKGIEKTINYYI